MGLLDDKVVLVNGRSQGIGAAIVRAAVREGAVVAVTGRRREPGEALVTELAAAGGKAMFVRADLADAEQARASVAEVIDAYGRIDRLANSAGLTSRGTLLDTTPERFDAHIAVNLKGPFFAMQTAVADMGARKAPGTIVTSSAHGGQPFLAPYVAAKAGRAFHGAGDDWREQAAAPVADGQARPAGRDRGLRGPPAVRPLGRGHRIGDRLGPERARWPRPALPFSTIAP